MERCPVCDAAVKTYRTDAGDTLVVDRLPSVHGYVRVVSLPRGLVRVEEERRPGLYVEHSCSVRANGPDSLDYG